MPKSNTKKTTTISISVNTKRRLRNYAKKISYFGKSWDDVINEILDILEEKT